MAHDDELDWMDEKPSPRIGMHEFSQAKDCLTPGICWCGKSKPSAVHLEGKPQEYTQVVDLDLPIAVLRNGINSAREAKAHLQNEMSKIQQIYDNDVKRISVQLETCDKRIKSYELAIDRIEG